MAQSLGEAFVDVAANTTRFQKDMEQGVAKSTKNATKEMGGLEKATSKVGAAAKQLVAAYVGIQGIRKVFQFATDSIRAYSDLEESINAVTVSFGDSAQEVTKLGESAARNLGLSNAEFNSLSVSVSAFTDKIAAGLGQEVPATLDTLTTRIADFASVMNLDVSEAFEKFRSGLAGESEPLRKFGIDVSAATVEQVALAEGIIKTGEEMTEADKVTARYLAIMQQTEKTAGDFANTSEGLANQTRSVAAELENQKAVLGEMLAPVRLLTLRIQTELTKALGNLAIGVASLTGELTDGQIALAEYLNATGTEAATIEDVIKGVDLAWQSWTMEIDVWRNRMDGGVTRAEDMKDALNELLIAQDVTVDGLRDYSDQLKVAFSAGEITELQFLTMSEALDDHLVRALDNSADAVLRGKAPMDALTASTADLGDETEELSEKVKTNSERLKDRQDQIRANTDPLFALSEATRKQAEAEEAVNEAVKEFGDASPEHIQALEDKSEANRTLKEAEDNVRVNVDLTREAFINQEVAMGNTRREAELLAERFSFLEAFKFPDKTIRISEVYDKGRPSVSGRQHGGPVSAGTPYLVGEVGREIFVPKVAGNIIPNDQITTGGITVGSIQVSLSGGATQADANMVADAIEDRLQKLSRARVVR